MNNASAPRSRGPRNNRRNQVGEPSRGRKGDPEKMDMMKMIGAFTNCLESFIRRFESPKSRTQSYKEITLNTNDVWVKNGTHAYALQYVHASILPILCDFAWLFAY